MTKAGTKSKQATQYRTASATNIISVNKPANNFLDHNCSTMSHRSLISWSTYSNQGTNGHENCVQ